MAYLLREYLCRKRRPKDDSKIVFYYERLKESDYIYVGLIHN